MLGAISATVSPRPIPRAVSADASRRQRSRASRPLYRRSPRAARQKSDRGQRHVIGRVLLKPHFIWVGHHHYPPNGILTRRGPSPQPSPRERRREGPATREGEGANSDGLQTGGIVGGSEMDTGRRA